MKNFTFILAISCFLGACASNVSRLPALASEAGAPYVLGAGDALQVVVFGEADLSGSYRVSDGGTIAVPLVGVLPAGGLTVAKFRETFIERLKTSAIRSPDVTVTVSEYRPFFILGEVKTPGLHPYVPNMTVLTAVAIAGGFTFRAAQNDISVTRQMEGESRESRALRDSRILPGDVVYVFERHL